MLSPSIRTRVMLGCTLISTALAVSLGLVVGLSYWPAAASLKAADCAIISLDKGYEYIRPGGAYSSLYFYDVGDAHPKYIWYAGNYYTINVGYANPNHRYESVYDRTFKDGYSDEGDRNRAYARLTLGNSTVPCWYRTGSDALGLVRQDLLVAPSWGVAVMTLALAGALVCWCVASVAVQ